MFKTSNRETFSFGQAEIIAAFDYILVRFTAKFVLE